MDIDHPWKMSDSEIAVETKTINDDKADRSSSQCVLNGTIDNFSSSSSDKLDTNASSTKSNVNSSEENSSNLQKDSIDDMNEIPVNSSSESNNVNTADNIDPVGDSNNIDGKDCMSLEQQEHDCDLDDGVKGGDNPTNTLASGTAPKESRSESQSFGSPNSEESALFSPPQEIDDRVSLGQNSESNAEELIVSIAAEISKELTPSSYSGAPSLEASSSEQKNCDVSIEVEGAKDSDNAKEVLSDTDKKNDDVRTELGEGKTYNSLYSLCVCVCE